MKTFFSLFFSAMLGFGMAQPQKFNYQGIALGSNGKPLKNATVSLRLSILDSAANGTVLYTETQPATTDAGGQFSVYLGTGTPTAGTFASLPWANGNDKFLKVEMDAQGGTNYQVMGTTQLVSVPYAMAVSQLKEGMKIHGKNGLSFQLNVGPNGPVWNSINQSNNFQCSQPVVYAGESYPTVQIGTQCWLAKNLNVGTMINGGSDQTNNSTVEKHCYNNDLANCSTYGGLYQWAEAVQYQNGASNSTSSNPAFTGNIRGICPTGWHLPSDAEWVTIEIFLSSSSVAGGAIKSTSGLWTPPNTGATNSSGFSALPSGYSNTNGGFYGIGNETDFWSSSEFSGTMAYSRPFYYDASNFYRLSLGGKDLGFSVRCIKN